MNEVTVPQLPEETVKAYQALCLYLSLGSDRSLELTHQKRTESGLKSSLTTLKTWSVKYNWQARLKQYVLLEQAELMAKWQGRQEAVRQADYAQAVDLRALANKILSAAPSFVKASTSVKQQADGTIREVTTVALDGALMINAISTASKLQRLATGIDTPGKVQVTIEYARLVSEFDKRGINASDVWAAMLQELAESDKLTHGSDQADD